MPKRQPVFDLKAELLIPDLIKTYENLDIPFLEIKEVDYKAKFIHFKQCKFQDMLLLKGAKLSNGLVFEDCEFYGTVMFKDIVVDQYDQVLTPDPESILFNNSLFKRVVIFAGTTQLDRGLVFEGCTFMEGVSIDRIVTNNDGLAIIKCTVFQLMDVLDCDFSGDLFFSENTINSTQHISSVKANRLAFRKSTHNAGLWVESCKLPDGIVFNDGTFKEDVVFSLNETEQYGLSVIGSVFEKTFVVNHHKGKLKPEIGITSYYFDSGKFLNGIFVRGIADLAVNFPKVNQIELNISPLMAGNIMFTDLDVGIINISGYNTAAKITFKHLEVRQIKATGLINESGLIFSDIIASRREWIGKWNDNLGITNTVYIDDSNFGKAQFFQVDLRSFDRIVFGNTILTEIATSNVKWFEPVQLADGTISTAQSTLKTAIKEKDPVVVKQARESLIRELNSRREIYRQLKYAAQKQGDIPLSHEFQRQEMEYYKEITRHERPRKWSEFIIMYTSQSNNFGQSWMRAFFGLIIFSLLSYAPVGWLTSDRLDYTKFATTFDDLMFNVSVLVLNLKTWLVLLNPTHRIKDITESIDKFPPIVYFFDLISRVVISYFIFQMVSAFRKFNK